MRVLDLIIIFGYLIGIVLFGTWFGRKQETTADYFLGDRSVPWWAVAFSIVATETSTITFISIPGIAFARGGNFGFLQLVFGYLLGRVVISILFIPSYFRGELLTVYQLLDQRFGGKIKMVAASLFVVMRNIADGIRLLLTAIVLAAVYAAFQPTANPGTIIVGSIILIGLAMIIFTYFGGMEAVIWVEVVQLGIYIAGAVAAAVVLVTYIGGGLSTVNSLATQFGKYSIFDFTLDYTRTFTFWSGLIGGCFLTMSTHGTDQYLVQRYLCTDRPRTAVIALLTSGGIDRVSVHRQRPPLSGLHHEVHAHRSFRAGGGGNLCGGDVVVTEFDRRYSSERSLQAIPAESRRQALFKGVARADVDVGRGSDPRGAGGSQSTGLRVEHGALDRVAHQWSNPRRVSRRDFSASGEPAAGADRHARQHRVNALRVLCDQDCVDVVRVSREPDHVCGSVGGEFCFRSSRAADRSYRTCRTCSRRGIILSNA